MRKSDDFIEYGDSSSVTCRYRVRPSMELNCGLVCSLNGTSSLARSSYSPSLNRCEATYTLPPVLSVEAMRSFSNGCHGLEGYAGPIKSSAIEMAGLGGVIFRMSRSRP